MLRVFMGFVGGGIRREAYNAVTRYAPIGTLELVNTSGEISTYWHELRKRWTGKHDLITIEQDNVIDAEVIPSFNACPEPWCVYEYIGPENMVARGVPDRMLKTSLGCTRFSQKLQQDVPIEEISHHDYFVWYLLDYRISSVLVKRGYTPHVHGKIEHLHNYSTDEARVNKEEELYRESIEKTKRNPETILAHPGMELDDAVPEEGEASPQDPPTANNG